MNLELSFLNHFSTIHNTFIFIFTAVYHKAVKYEYYN